jgi:hypothetical protein
MEDQPATMSKMNGVDTLADKNSPSIVYRRRER